MKNNNMKGYAFIANSSKPSVEENLSRAPVVPGNVSIPCIEAAMKLGYDVFLGINRKNPDKLECTYPVSLFDSHTYRSITAVKDNIIAYKNLSEVVDIGNIQVIHCNTPVGGMIGRLVGKIKKVDKIIYTAHGFHFYKGAPLFNRTIIKWAERLMARWTDAIITMNEEDYQSALKFNLRKGGKVYKVNGVGINLENFNKVKVNKLIKRSEFGLKDDDIICISAGDLVKRKNYKIAIEALARADNSKLHYIICGIGPEKHNLIKFAKDKGVYDRVHFLGFRKDIIELMKASDIFIFTTLQEGLPRSMMEAMACGLPCVASNIRGNVDLLVDGEGGYLKEANDVSGFAGCLDVLSENSKMRKRMSSFNKEVIKKYDVDAVRKQIFEIYEDIGL